MKKVIQKLIVSILFLSCSLKAHEEKNAFEWNQEKTAFAQLVMQTAGPGIIQNTIQVSGKVIAHPDYFAYVIPKVSGCVCQVRKNLGDSVEKDEVLALVESQEIAVAKAGYLTAQKQFNLYQALWKKEKNLKGLVTEQDYLKAELAAQEAEIQMQLAMQNLYALGFTPSEVEQIEKKDLNQMRFYEIKAPIKGKILQRSLTLGEIAGTSTKAFTIGNFDKVCVEIHVPQCDAKYVKEGLNVELATSGKSAVVKISQFNPLISEETRTAMAIASIDNELSNWWSPGEFVTANVQTEVAQAQVVVPLTALQTIKGEHFVFVESGHEFIPHAVKLGKKDKQNVEIVSGLSPGMVYAAQNTFALKAEFEKEEAEHTH